jgi:NhaP-type Na+/H+ or K+/H+ antiporter
MDHSSLLISAALIVLIGVMGLAVAEMLGVPSIALLLLLGVIAGPHVLGLLDPAALGPLLPVIIKLGVAIIVFEGAITLSSAGKSPSSRIIRDLSSAGFAITFALAGTLYFFFIERDLPMAMLFAALASVTGPTVVQPLLKRVHVKKDIADILRSEAIYIEPIGVLIAALIFNIVAAYAITVQDAIAFLIQSVIIGGTLGVSAGVLLRVTLKSISTSDEVRNLYALAVLLAAFALSESIVIDSGVLVAALAGLVLSGSDFPGKEQLLVFKGQLTLLIVAVIFILISADINLVHIARLGIGGIALVVLMILLVRPLSVWLCTRKSKLRFNEKAFLAATAPRGIVAGAVASLFAMQLSELGYPRADTLSNAVFLLIGVTVLLIAPFTPLVARLCGIFLDKQKYVIIVGAHPLGRLIASRMRAAGYETALIDTNQRNCELASREQHFVFQGSALDNSAMQEAGAEKAGVLLAMTPNNETNILITQSARRVFRIPMRAILIQPGTDKSTSDFIRKSDIRVMLGSDISLAYWNRLIDEGDYIFIKHTLNRRLDGTETLLSRLKHIALPMFLDDRDSVKPIFRSAILDQGDTIHFLVRKSRVSRFESEISSPAITVGAS